MKKKFFDSEMVLVLGLFMMGAVFNTSAESYPAPEVSGPGANVTFPGSFSAFKPPLTNGAPVAGAPDIAEWARQNQPGDTMALTCENISVYSGDAKGRDSRFVFYGEGAGFFDGLIQRLADRQCALTLPSELPANDMYLMWPRNDNGFGEPVAINKADAWWVGPDQATRGEMISIYGRNLILNGGRAYLYVENYGWLTSVTANPYKADFQVPGDMNNGTYTVFAHNGHGREYGWSSGVTLIVNNGSSWSGGKTINVKNAPYSAKGDGVSDDFNAINSALNDAGSGDTVYLPAGTYLISDYFRDDFNNTRIIGDGMDQTIIKTHPSMSRDWMVYGAIKNASIENLTLGAGTGGTSDMTLMRINGSQNALFKNVRFSQLDYKYTPRGGIVYLGGAANHVVFKDCEFVASGNIYLGDLNTRQVFFDGCDFYGMHDLNTVITANMDELSIINCTLQNLDGSNATNSFGWCKGRFIAGQPRVTSGQKNDPSKWYFGGNSINAVSPRNAAPFATATLRSFSGATATVDDASGFVVGKQMLILDGPSAGNYANITAVDTVSNTITISKSGWLTAWAPDPTVGDTIGCRDDVDGNSGEMFMCESSRTRYRAQPVSATASTVTFSSISGYFTGMQAYIVSGKGQGQSREITGLSGSTITLESPWRVVPDTGSVIALSEGSSKFIVYGNHFEGTQDSLNRNVASTGVEIYGTGADWIVDGNSFESLRQGVCEYSYMNDVGGTYVVCPIFFFYCANNLIENCYEGIERPLRMPSSGSSIDEPLLIGSVFRENSILNCIGAAIDCELETQYRNANVIEMTVWDKNEARNSSTLFVGRDGFFNQVWIGNTFVGPGNGVGLTHLNETAALRENSWQNFSQKYSSSSPGGILEVPKRVCTVNVSNLSAQVDIYNSGTAALDWTATTDSTWLNLDQTSGTVADESSTGTLTVTVDAESAPTEDTSAIITVTSDSAQTQQIAVEYSVSASPPPPDGPPDPVLTGIVVEGPTSIDEETSAQYTCIANWSDGTTTTVTPTWSENSSYASISAGGLLSAGNVSTDQAVTITATYGSLTATYNVDILYVAPVLTGITISGPVSVNEETTAQYSCTAIWSDGTTQTVVPIWSENSSYATISGSGVLTAGNVTSDQSVTITASYGGKTDTHAVTIKYVAPTLNGITISGLASINEQTTAQYNCTANWSDGTTTTVTPSWSENSSFATISGSGVLSAGNVTSDQNVTITASYGGKTDTHAVIIRYVAPVLSSITISGPTSVDEETTAQYSCTANWSDGTTTTVSPTWSENSSFATINASGVLSAGNVTADQNVVITANYGGKSDTHAVTVKYLAPTVTSITIAGPTSVDEETTAQYSCTANWSDGTTTTVTPTWSENSAFATISASGLFTAGTVTTDENVIITASFGGKTDTHALAIENIPATLTSITITGPTSINEETTAQYNCTASWSDGTTTTVTPNWSENSSFTTINGSGVLSAGNVTADQSVTITASYGGMTDTHAVTIKYVAPTLSSISISGPTSVDEETTAQYSCSASWSDGTTTTVTPTWSENSLFTTINANGVLSAGNVTADQGVTITASYGGKTDTHLVTIKYVAPTLDSITISGPVSIDEETTAQYRCTASWSDGTTTTVTPLWTENSSFATINLSGVLSAGNVSSDQAVTITASYNGKSDTHSVTILYVAPPVVLTGISISGPDTLEENSTGSYACTATYSDGSSASVNPVWSVNDTSASISTEGVLTTGNIEADQVLNVSASYSGAKDSHAVNVLMVGTQIIFPLSGFEGKTVWARLWDESAQEWHDLGEMVNPSELVIENVNPDQWYWISIKEYDDSIGDWVKVHSSWISM